jgi:hypothetical protein
MPYALFMSSYLAVTPPPHSNNQSTFLNSLLVFLHLSCMYTVQPAPMQPVGKGGGDKSMR